MPKTKRKCPHDARLVCRVERLEYDFTTRTGRIYFPKDNCCDMRGCLNLFDAIDRKAQVVHTYAGDDPDTRYRRESPSSWMAFPCEYF